MSPSFNNLRQKFSLRSTLAISLALLLILSATPSSLACGPSYIQPIYVFTTAPDWPFDEFAAGKIGIVKPTFGRKTLTIAFRYLNGGSFTGDEQKALIPALRGRDVSQEEGDPVRDWVTARKEFVPENEKLPEIYAERRYGGYDFFPNCTPNAFQVATETLKARVNSYGANDKDVRAWIAAQDTVFQNCSSTASIPAAAGNESPEWLRKDRDYQIAAAHFYSLHFDEARTRFAAIANDPASPWQEVSDYLVGRTWVRQGSLIDSEAQQTELYKQAELYLQGLVGRSQRYNRAARKLLALVKYRLHPEERVGELARTLAYENGNDNLGQDLIDYVWLVDRFEADVFKEKEKEKTALQPAEQAQPAAEPSSPYTESLKRYREIQERARKGEILAIMIYRQPQPGVSTPEFYEGVLSVEAAPDASEVDVLQAFEVKLGRKINPEEEKQIKQAYEAAVEHQRFQVSPNRKFDEHRNADYAGCSYGCDQLEFSSIPKLLRAEELTDWILTLQNPDAASYSYALQQWRKYKTEAWLALLLIKAQKTSPRLVQLMRRAERVGKDSPAFPTIAYHLIRLKIALGQTASARMMLDEIISWQTEMLPLSAQNQFLEQRMRLAKTLDEFLEFSGRRPITFYEEGNYGKIRNFVEQAKTNWDPKYNKESKEDFERAIEEHFKSLLPWDNQPNFDDETVELINWHFPLSVMLDAIRSPALPSHLKRRLVLTAWTRAVVLKQPGPAQKLAPMILEVAPELQTGFQPYLDARTPEERNNAALYIMLKYPSLSPMMDAGVPLFHTVEEIDYYFEIAWWCPPSNTEYNDQGSEVAKRVAKPAFLTTAQVDAARRERAALVAVGDAKKFLGTQAIAWAKSAPDDPRVPEALYIAVQANSSYKYGCSSWEYDKKIRGQAESLLQTKYPQSPWTAKLTKDEN